MNLTKKILLTIIICLCSIVGFSTLSVAQIDLSNNDYDEEHLFRYLDSAFASKDTVQLRYTTFYQYPAIYCVQHLQGLHSDNMKYKVVEKVNITGNVLTDSKGNTSKNDQNAIFAYILSQRTNPTSDNLSGNGAKDDAQPTIAVWKHLKNWYNNSGIKGVLNSSFFNFDTYPGYSEYYEEAKRAVANGWGKNQNLTRNNTKIKIDTSDKQGYMRIGPLNYSFSGEMSSIVLKDQNGKSISGLKCTYFKGKTETEYSKVGDIPSGSNFYICIPISANVNKVTQIQVKTRNEVTSVDIWFLDNVPKSEQNLIARRVTPEEQILTNTFDDDIPVMGNLKVIKVDADNKTIKLPNVKFIIKNESTGKYVKKQGNTISYVAKKDATEFKTNEEGEITIENLVVGTYKAYETENPNDGYQIIEDGVSKDVVVDKTAELEIPNRLCKGNLKVIKVDKNNQEVKLPNVGFVIYRKNNKTYVKKDNKGNISYVSKREEATEFKTDENGEIFIEGLIVGNYVAYETQNPNYGYEVITEGKEKKVVVDKTQELKIPNEQIYIKLSGYVWVDKIDGKRSERNDLYKTGVDNETGRLVDTNDVLFNGITVRLKDKTTGEIVQNKDGKKMETVTQKLNRYPKSVNDGNGEYLFEGILIEKLKDYYVEFEYDGLTYTNVVAHTNQNSGSKAAETVQEREAFNQNFSVVEGKTRDTGLTRNAQGQEKHELSYHVDEAAHTATLINNGQYKITANTDTTKYNIGSQYTEGQEEIRYINLGLYERAQPDIALEKDMKNVRLTVNGYEHTYLYGKRIDNEEYGDGFNVGVKFGVNSEYGKVSYTRAIYKSDFDYENEKDRSKELKVYVTYQIRLYNQSANLKTKINSIVDYYDSRYNITKVGTTLTEQGIIQDSNIAFDQTSYNENYKKAIIQVNEEMASGRKTDIYVEFELDRQGVLNIINDGENLNNVVEINSYSVYDQNGKVYAGIDMDSNPGNAVPDDIRTYEDDTDTSPALKLEIADAREISGKVFLDQTSKELKVGEIRQGNGAYDKGEIGIEKVNVTLTENTGSGKVYTATTDANGDFLIAGYIPGQYTLTYTWGDNTYTVQNYKGTIYDNTRNQSDKLWYKKDVDKRLTDAIDNYQTRMEIDEEMKDNKNGMQITKTTMNSTTPTMEMGIEYETTYTASTGDRYTYRIYNIDFGIVERARQEVLLTKRVKTMKATLASGQQIVDLTIDENGNITGQKTSVTYMAPSENTVPKNGFIKLELDNELIQGCKVEIGYEIKVTNRSELDYLSEKFYQYGIVEGEKVTMTPNGIIDYLSKEWSFDSEQNKQWTIKTMEDINSEGLVAEVVYNDPNSTIEDKIILYTDSLKDTKLAPKESASVMLNVSKLLTVEDEISLDNETEIVQLTKTGGSKLSSTPGNYIPGTESTETDDDKAETTIITPNTGDNLDYVLPITIGIALLAILGTGIIIIKKKVLHKE